MDGLLFPVLHAAFSISTATTFLGAHQSILRPMTSFPGRGPPAPPPPGMEATDARALKRAGGEFLERGNGVIVGGWRVETTTTPILGKAELDAMEKRLGTAHLPEMVYGSTLELVHLSSGARLHFNAEDALREWLEEDLPPLKVAAAAAWAEGHRSRFGDAAPPGPRDSPASPPASWDDTETQAAYDWTFTTPYRGSVDVVEDAAPGTATPAELATDSAPVAPRWVPTDARVDRGMLMERDPILFFDEITLYESELDDSGVMSVTVKVRVMPRCWFVLMRFWMRCDGVLVRLRETRFFSKMESRPTPPPGMSEEKRAALAASLEANAGPCVVVRESARREETFEGLRARGAPSEPAKYPDADEAASVLLAAGGPVEMAYHALVL